MKELLEQYPVVLSQDVLWGDMDAFEHVNNTVYFRYFEDARIAYFNMAGIIEHKGETNIGPILANTECDFKLPLKYPDEVYIAGRSTILSPKKIKMNYLVYSKNLEGIAAEGQGLLIYYNYNTGRTCEIPENIVEAIKNLEKN